MHSLNKLTLAVLLGQIAALLALVFSSYPNLKPGLDVWWHLGLVDLVEREKIVNGFEWRFTWHTIWAGVSRLAGVDDHWGRALLIHRVQYLMTLILIGASAYLLLRHTVEKTKESAIPDMLSMSLWAAIIWMVMHGTNSSRQVLAWIGWYSVNYQIALPICIFGGSCFLAGILPNKKSPALLWVALACALIVTIIHALELAYFLIFVIIAVIVSFKIQQAPMYVGIALLAIIGGIVVANTVSYRAPEILGYIQKAAWSDLVREIGVRGEWVASGGRNRPLSGWNSLTLVCFVSAVVLLVLRAKSDPAPFRVSLFVMLTGLVPLALLTKTGAGLLSMITYTGVAWRFAFASYLFVAIPMLVVHLTSGVASHLRWLFQNGIMFAILGVAFAHSAWIDTQHVTLRFAHSLLKATDPREMHFGLDGSQASYLSRAARLAREQKDGSPLCVDPYSAHYLYFVERVDTHVLPGRLLSLEEMRGVKVAGQARYCDFPRDGGDLRRLGMEAPPWHY